MVAKFLGAPEDCNDVAEDDNGTVVDSNGTPSTPPFMIFALVVSGCGVVDNCVIIVLLLWWH